MPAADADRKPPPYAGLSAPVVLDALDGVGLRGDGRLLTLNSYENRVYQAFLEDGRVVVAKFYRPGRWSDEQIAEEHAFAAELVAAECPVAAPMELAPQAHAPLPVRLLGTPTLAEVETDAGAYRYAVSERRAGRAPELEDDETLAWIGRFIGRIHAVGATRSYAHRRTLDVAGFGIEPRDWLLASGVIAPELLPRWKSAADRAIDAAASAFDRLGDALAPLRLHGDCHVGNLLWSAAGPHFVDLDDTLTGPAVQDLWLLLSGEPQAARRQLAALLSGYERFADFDDRQLALVEPLRTLRMLHHSAWLARRWDDPAFKAGFPWFGEPSYWAQQAIELDEQVQAMRGG